MSKRKGQLGVGALAEFTRRHVAAWCGPAASEVSMSDDFTTFTRMPEAGNIAAVFPDDDHAKPRGDGFTARSPALPDVLVDFAELVASETPSRELHRDDHHPAAAREHFNAQCPAGRVAGLDSVAA